MHAAGFLVVYKFFIWATNKTTTYLMLSYADKEILKNVYGKSTYQEK